MKCYLFTLRLSYSGKAVHRVFASGGQEAFSKATSHAFSVLGGVPTGKVRYDNLQGRGRPGARVRPAPGGDRPVDRVPLALRLRRVLLPARASRALTRRAASRARSAGSAATTWSRSPRSTRSAELNAHDRRVGRRRRRAAGSATGRGPSGEYFAVEQPLLRAAAGRAVRDRRWLLTPRVDRYARSPCARNRYSVPARLIGRQVRVLLHASELVVFDGRAEVARHERLIAKGGSRLDLDHYLEVLVRKPGALPGATALDQARAAGQVHPGPRRVVGRRPQGPRRRATAPAR